MSRSMVVPAGGGPRDSQFGGTLFQVCLTRIWSQFGARDFAILWRGAESSTQSMESWKCCIVGGFKAKA